MESFLLNHAMIESPHGASEPDGAGGLWARPGGFQDDGLQNRWQTGAGLNQGQPQVRALANP